tara:strand:+ start:19 stop:684 length:666 start_codon:yes stop_codon:yes gene_type:complete
MKTFTQLTATNDGNTINTQEIKYPVSIFSTLFVSGEERVKSIDGQRYLVWERTLKPNESTTINFVTNYRVLFYVAVILVIFLIFYYAVKSPISVTKKATTTKSDEEGALSQIKITLEVRNRGTKPLKHVSITDLVPAIANVERMLELGTLKPKDIKHAKSGTRVSWELAELDGHEHRLITYKVKAKLNILGTFSLPRAVVQYSKGRGKRGKAYSNIFRLSN